MKAPDSFSLNVIRALLCSSDNIMPGQRFQDPSIEQRLDIKRPFYYIRPYVPMVTADGLQRKRKRIPLGFLDEITMREAKAAKGRVMATINDNKFVIQSQLPFKDILDRYVEVRLPQIPATRASYQNKIDKHIRPAFTFAQEGRKQKRLLRICEIDKAMVESWLNAKAEAGYSHNTLLDL